MRSAVSFKSDSVLSKRRYHWQTSSRDDGWLGVRCAADGVPAIGLEGLVVVCRNEVNVALRKRKANALLLEAVPDLNHHCTLDVGHPGGRVVDPDSKIKIDGAFAERGDKAN